MVTQVHGHSGTGKMQRLLGECNTSCQRKRNTPYSKHIVFVNRFAPPASDPKSEILEFIPKSVFPKAVMLSTESENNCGGCLFLSLQLNLSAVYMLEIRGYG